VEALISLRGQMDEEFDRNKQKQGMLFFSAMRYWTSLICSVVWWLISMDGL
jgi:hypothetical protein